MGVKETVMKQCRDAVATGSQKVSGLEAPTDGWLRTSRKALKMPVKAILQKAHISKSELYRREKAEINGSLTLNKLKKTANAMGCELHYAVVPKGTVEDLIEKQARHQAIQVILNANINAPTEKPKLTKEQVAIRVNEIADELKSEMPEWFWEDVLE